MKVVLIGDSIRMGYQPFVARKLEGRADVWGPPVNCRHSLWALDHFGPWVAERQPDPERQCAESALGGAIEYWALQRR